MILGRNRQALVPSMMDHEIQCEGHPNQAYDQGKNGSDAAIKDPSQLSIRKAAKPSEPLYPAPSKFIPHIQETERDQPNPKQKNENVLCHEMTKAPEQSNRPVRGFLPLGRWGALDEPGRTGFRFRAGQSDVEIGFRPVL